MRGKVAWIAGGRCRLEDSVENLAEEFDRDPVDEGLWVDTAIGS